MPWFGPTATKPKDISTFKDLYDSQFDVDEDSEDNERYSLEILGL